MNVYRSHKELVSDMVRCRKWIQGALDKGNDTHDFEHIVQGVLAGDMQFWANDRCCAVTEIVVYPKKKVIHGFLVGGNLDGLSELHENAIKWAKELGCTDFTMLGRRGWLKVMPEYGWEDLNQNVMVKRL